MDAVRDHALRALRSGALDPGQERALREQIAASPELTARLAALKPEPSPPSPADAGWRVPRAPRAESTLAATLSFDGARRRVVRIADRPDAASCRLILLAREAGVWRCVWPPDADGVRTLDQLTLLNGARELVWDPSGFPEAEAWAIALPPIALPIDWDADEETRWSAIIAAMLAGAVPVWRLDEGENPPRR